MKLLVSLALALVAAKSVSGQCDYDFCAGGITVPDAIVNPEDDPSEQATCAQVPYVLGLCFHRMVIVVVYLYSSTIFPTVLASQLAL